ncbi:MAG TPA: YIP1 family protein [Terriglobales bacterium]|nr:YIP1 family protein [Terriglobales bacterium]
MSSASSAIPMPSQETGLSEPQRIINVFFSPLQTFADIRRTSRWWSPFLIGCVLSYVLCFAVATKVGWSQAAENTIKLQQPKQYEKIQALPPDQQAAAMGRVTSITKFFAYGGPAVWLIMYLIFGAILLATFNFGIGTELKFSQVLAILFYSSLVLSLKRGVIGAITLFAGMNAENFNFDNFVGSNPAYYMSVTDTPPWLYNLLSYFDVFTIWTYILIGIGFAVVGRRKLSTGIAVMGGWYAFVLLLTTGLAAMRS